MITNGAVGFVAFGQPLINAKGVELSCGANKGLLRRTVLDKNTTGDFVRKLTQEKNETERERERDLECEGVALSHNLQSFRVATLGSCRLRNPLHSDNSAVNLLQLVEVRFI